MNTALRDLWRALDGMNRYRWRAVAAFPFCVAAVVAVALADRWGRA